MSGNRSILFDDRMAPIKGISHAITYPVTGTPQCIAMLISILMQL
jgi:hypothetical protein